MGKQIKVETPKVVRPTDDHQTIHPNLVVVKELKLTMEQEAFIASIEGDKGVRYL